MKPRIFVATKAFILFQGKILILRESSKYTDGTNAGRYDVPGGRVEPGEKFSSSLLREIKEETGLRVKVGRPFFTSEWRPVVRGRTWQIVCTFFECQSKSDNVVLSKDHDSYEWIEPKKFRRYLLIHERLAAFESYIDFSASKKPYPGWRNLFK
jgi:8-oxo-dGTP diphosphatase